MGLGKDEIAATGGRRTYIAITFTAEEKSELAKAITKAACGIAECWDILSQIGDRIGRDWDPEGTSVADIAEHNASDLDNPEAIECLDADSVVEYFGDDENWKRSGGDTKNG